MLLALGFGEFWGDAHHNLIMSKLTLDHHWVYSDFKDRHLTWLPLYRYWGSFILFLTGIPSLFVMHVVNTVVGALAAVAGSWLGTQLVDRKTGLFAGIGIALMPYLMVFSYVNMGEMQGGLFLLLWVVGIHKRQFWLVAVTAFLAALTRYELIFLMGVAVLPLWILRQRNSAGFTVGGLALALGVWSLWAWTNTGNPLNWLLMRFASTTTSSGFYAKEAGVFFRYIFLPFAALLQAFPLIVFFIWFKRKKEPEKEDTPTLFLLGLLTVLHWVFFFIAQTKIMAYPDTRFFVISLPVTTVWFFALLGKGYFRSYVRPRLVFFFLGVSLLQLLVPYYRQFSLQPRKEIGWWMAKNLPPHTQVWSDMAVSIVESRHNYHNFYSSEILIPKNEREHLDAIPNLMDRLDSLNVEYLTSYPAPFDFTSQLIPELNQHEPFEWNGISFVPVFIYQPYQMREASVHSYLRYSFEKATKPASIWRIYLP